MIPKNFIIKAPVDASALFLERFLGDVSRNALKSISGSYTGDGSSSKSVLVGFKPIILIISENISVASAAFPVTKDMVFSLGNNDGVSYIPGTGFVKDAITGYSNGSISLGVNANVNTAGTNYLFLAIG